METAEKHIALKVHETERGPIMGACDVEVLGKRLVDGELELEISENFYFERHVSPEEFLEVLESCMTANLVGEKTVGAYCKKNPDAEAAVVSIKGVPHLQIYTL